VCHLRHAGRPMPQACDDVPAWRGPVVPSDAATNVHATCLRQLSAEGFGAFTTFTAHTDNLCYYLRAAAWRGQTAALVANLSTAAADTASTLTQVAAASRELKSAYDAATRDNQRAWNVTARSMALQRQAAAELAEVTTAIRGDVTATVAQFGAV
jgi:predicted HAD superfamily phosphohydrolase